ncbi:BRO-N domain-containing protein [Desulfovibrio piger]|uniref:BRO-N domain-containing protein n=1 Tax=Desulfovibrio piger TaxID=901 RepID=UPI0026ED87EB|nr:BRO family protein [Desulfovibrio piger]
MTTALTFNDVVLYPIPYQNSLWIRAVELAKALGFKREDQAAKIYRSHADEFTPDMAQLVEITGNANSAFPVKSLIFSLRGCHLVAMFARTPVAKAFRRWVLDVLDKLDAEQHATLTSPTPDDFTSPLSLTPSTTEDRKPLRALVGSWAKLSNSPFDACWNQLKAAFQIANIKELPQEWIPDALAWVQAKIDALPKALPPQPERLPLYRNGCFYPPHRDRSHVPGPQEVALLELWQDWTRREVGLRQEFMPCCGNWTPAAATCSATPCPTWAAMLIPCSARSACWTACSRAARKPSNDSARPWRMPACTCA